MKVLKFGGYAIDSAENILRVKEIIDSQSGSVVVVVSAFHGVTDQLQELSRLSSSRDRNLFRIYNEIETKHIDIINNIFEEPFRSEVISHINHYLKDLISIINGVYLLNDLTPKLMSSIS
jgi:aspartokinase/homoserine dehydrogenase 1